MEYKWFKDHTAQIEKSDIEAAKSIPIIQGDWLVVFYRNILKNRINGVR